MKYYTIISQKNCQPCQKARELIYEKEHDFVNVVYLDTNPYLRTLMVKAGLKTTPQVFDGNGKHIGGYDDLVTYFGEA